MDEPNLTVVLRPFKEEDTACIYTTWRNGLWYGAFVPYDQSAKNFFKECTKNIRRVLTKAHIMIACLENTPSMIVGYSVSTGDHLDWIYVKADYRSSGVGTMLMPPNIKTVTADLTKVGSAIVKKKSLITKEN